MPEYTSDLYLDEPTEVLNGEYNFEEFKPEGMWIGMYNSVIRQKETFIGECCLCTGEGMCENEHGKGKFFYFTTNPGYYWKKAEKFCEEAGILDQLESIQVKFLYTVTVGTEGKHYGEKHDLIWELNITDKGYWYTYAPFNSSVCSSPFCLLFRGHVDKSFVPPDAEYDTVCFRGPDSCSPCLKDMKCVIEEEGEKIVMNHCNNQCYVEEGICFACDCEDFTQHFVIHQKDMHGLAEFSTDYPVQLIALGETIEVPIQITNHWGGADILTLELDR